MKEIIKKARNVEEAIELACRELGAPRDQVEFEIIDLPKRGFFGLRNTPAKVRVYIEEPETVEPEIQAEPIRTREKKEDKPERPARQKPAPKEEPRRSKPAQKQEKGQSDAKQPAEKPRNHAPQPQKEAEQLQFVGVDQVDGKAKVAADYVHSVLTEIGVTAEITVAFTDNGIILRLSGEGLGVIIGRRGETLDALQYLTGLVANRQEGEYMRVTIDSGNYREKRERTLQQLAKKLSASAIRYGRPSTLEPMNPYERRIIHSTVSKIDGVSSSSVGEEPNRRVVITPDRLRPQSGNRGRGGRGRPRRNDHRDGGDNRRRGNNNANRPANRGKPGETAQPTSTDVDRAYAKQLEQTPCPAPTNSQPAEKPESAPVRTEIRSEVKDLPLYGKIEL